MTVLLLSDGPLDDEDDVGCNDGGSDDDDGNDDDNDDDGGNDGDNDDDDGGDGIVSRIIILLAVMIPYLVLFF